MIPRSLLGSAAASRPISAAIHAKAGGRSNPYTLIVDPNGDDGNAGTEAAPLKTLDGARLKVRTLTSDQKRFGVSVLFNDGTYPVTDTVTFAAADSGPSADRPTVYQARNPGKAAFTGGSALTGWALIDDGDAAYEHLSALAKAGVYVCDLGALGLNAADCGSIRTVGTTGEAFLVYREVPQTLARYPNTGYLTVPATDTTAPIKTTPSGADGARVAAYAYDTSDIWVEGWMTYVWYYTRTDVTAIDPGTGEMTLTTPTYGGVTSGMRYRILNVLEELDSEGEYYIDRSTLKLYFWPPTETTAADLNTGCAIASWGSDYGFVYTDGANNLRFEGLAFKDSSGVGAHVKASNVEFYNCSFTALGSWGVLFNNRVGEDVRVRRCAFNNLLGGAVWIKPTYYDLAPPNSSSRYLTLQRDNHVVEDCRIDGACIVDRSTPAIYCYGVGSTVSHNEFYDLPASAIGFGGNDHTIAWNLIDGACTEAGDAGAIYSGRNLAYRGSVIRYNRVQNMESATTGIVHGVYLDDRLSGTTVESNLFYDLRDYSTGVFNGGGRDNMIANNCFHECLAAMWLDDRGNVSDLAARTAELTAVMGAPNGSDVYESSVYAKYDGLLNILNESPLSPMRTQILNNVENECTNADTESLTGTPSTVVEIYADSCNYYRPSATHYHGDAAGIPGIPDDLAPTPGGNADLAGFVAWDVSDVGCRL